MKKLSKIVEPLLFLRQEKISILLIPPNPENPFDTPIVIESLHY